MHEKITTERRDRFGAACLLIGFLSVLAPLLMVAMPPVLDYPNHFARLWMIAGGIESPPLDTFYAIDWSRAGTNIGGDVLAALTGPLLGKNVYPRILLTLSILLPPVGALLLHRRLFGPGGWWPMAFVFAAWGITGLVGFMNFQVSLGLALAFAAFDKDIGRLPAAAGFFVRAALTGLVLAWHPFGATFYAGLLVALAFGRDPAPYRHWAGIKRQVVPIVLAALAGLAPIVMLSVSHNPVAAEAYFGGGRAFLEWAPFTIAKKISILSLGFRSYLMWADALVALVVAGAIVAAAVRRQLAFHFGLVLLVAFLGVAAVLMPTRIGDAYWTDRRFPIMAFLTLLVAFRPDLRFAPALHRALIVALLALALIRTSGVSAAWAGGQKDIQAVRAAVSHLPVGASLITVARYPGAAEIAHAPAGRYLGAVANFWNYATLAVPWRQAYVPNLFSARGQQPLKVLPPWDVISTPHSPPPRISQLYPSSTPNLAYVDRWRACFEYMLLLNADLPDAERTPLPLADLELVSDERFAVLYRIRTYSPQACATTPGPKG